MCKYTGAAFFKGFYFSLLELIFCLPTLDAIYICCLLLTFLCFVLDTYYFVSSTFCESVHDALHFSDVLYAPSFLLIPTLYTYMQKQGVSQFCVTIT
ncbi:uncharacterized protein BDV14DRAFT_99286 [Aspergillus stella-maris]|uniref:uncharacterized protein n=1 Tax=Aspergillus stella-maris TaxID=1810926 RepID=UPI003CCCB627